MENFVFQNPTKLIFGKGMISSLSKEIPPDKKIMVTFGGGSVKKNGVYDAVKSALVNHNYIEFWGIEPNPSIETLRKAIALGKENNVNFLLAVGGGSVLRPPARGSRAGRMGDPGHPGVGLPRIRVPSVLLRPLRSNLSPIRFDQGFLSPTRKELS